MNVCIVGTGYVGLVSAACFAEMGNRVACVDVNPRVVETLKGGKVHIYEPGLEELVRRNTEQGRLDFTTSLEEGMADSEVVFITVGTPQAADGTCDLSYVEAVAREIGQRMTSPKIVVDKSTVPVGTADRVRAIIAEELGRRGADIAFDVVSNPEFLKEGDAVGDFMKPDRVIVGSDSEHSAKVLGALYGPFARSRDKLVVMGVRSAEMTKYAANCMLATKISFINEIANICERVGANVSEVRAGIGSDSRIGYSFIYPGVGYGGSCFPKDVKALISTASDHGYDARLIRSVDEVNNAQKHVLADKIIAYFNEQGGVAGRTLALWGIAFKANTDDIREASAIEVIRDLTALGMKVRAFDPVAGDRAREELGHLANLEIADSQYGMLDGADALAVVTDWNQFRDPDFDRIRTLLTVPLVFDGRNLYQPERMGREGFAYFSIGRVPVK
ncbi:MAG: UDP-glucose/GDP-mannose dehydrogenase family protein [Pseudodesulfovibrio sp.]|uniref:UDP-glucose 6-dehydrogenase n=1 Tax=Pseudodesulfovibrio aespoeensis (strain ATCC 700646 / DSM 10631 / Aspo-2) TaxID=643562 RepID=E6VYI6_PSEA9|nr:MULTISPECIES: UDP-glucose/GDP-mannose dehydrogenase family protein [Pseudodesulfovibrio]MBU4244718.1 UDP-glucose/GDP-mannose dehydrogenase family protein [Pseudomonadota bacterium]ADU62749.1 nucleotide sugar dehydrogenase [Pseudodesulfovibrio aespoeensis Aspo-2]MBU4379434.1 UDP-glucose/GDP-mannose dehydrogenase family protein [Pseudomonadota bacterium]MBU4474200.1 UDP-glucose/GDP-mannose dehydrogenase family protein [Pseudomonadota bacterium]MBU4515686.1 UDP-glucose/GDP-mannose dehydrogenas